MRQFFANADKFKKRKGGDGYGNPAAHPAFCQAVPMDHAGRTGGQDTVLGFVVEKEFDLGFPPLGILDLIQQKGGGFAVGIGALMIEG